MVSYNLVLSIEVKNKGVFWQWTALLSLLCSSVFISKPLFLCWEPITSRFSIVSPPPLYLVGNDRSPRVPPETVWPYPPTPLPPPHKILRPASPVDKWSLVLMPTSAVFRSPNAVVNIVQLKSGMLISSDNSQIDSSDHRVEKFPY